MSKFGSIITSISVLFILVLTGFTAAKKPKQLSPKKQLEIAAKAYQYGYPLVLMEYTKNVRTNTELPNDKGLAPINQFGSISSFPTAGMTDVVRPNVDTYYSMVWFDLTDGPIWVKIPATEHYYLMPILNAYTDVIASPGSRTTGQEELEMVIIGPNYNKPVEAEYIVKSNTNMAWLIGRVRVHGKQDAKDVVTNFQSKLEIRPYDERKNEEYIAPKGKVDTAFKYNPMQAVDQLSTEEFFNEMMRLMVDNPASAKDEELLNQMALIGLTPGGQFNDDLFLGSSKEEVKMIPQMIQNQWKQATGKDQSKFTKNGWMMITEGLGEYGTQYDLRAYIAHIGLGANQGVDAVYPNTSTDADHQPLMGGQNYVLHFDAKHLPRVNGFWSITLYDENGFLIENTAGKYAIQDEDDLVYNEDGSLDIYIQSNAPQGKEANWLPTPAKGNFAITMRLYWPDEEVLDGSWSIPAIKKAK